MTRHTTNHDWPAPEAEDPGSAYVSAFDTLIDALDDEVILKDTGANRPGASTPNRWFLATDDRILYRDNGTSWDVIAAANPADLDGSGGTAGDTLVTDGTSISWASGSGSGIDADTVDGYEGSALAALAENENVTGEYTFSNGMAVVGNPVHFRGTSDDTWIAQYTTTPPAGVQKATSEAVLLGSWTNGSGNTGYLFYDQNDNIALEVIPDTGEVYAHGQVSSNGNPVAEKTASQTITGLWTFDNVLALADQAADPTAAGRFALNGTDVKVHTGGGVVNLSDVGGSATVQTQEDGSNVDASDTLNFGAGVDASSSAAGTTDVRTDPRGTPNLHIPYTDLAAGDYVAVPQYVPSGTTLSLWAYGVRDDSQSNTSLNFELYNVTSSTSVLSDSYNYTSGSLATPLATVDATAAAQDVEFRLHNGRASAANVGATASYTIEPAGAWSV